MSRAARRRARRVAMVVACALALTAQSVQRVDPSPADRAIAAGWLVVAESALYEAARRAPRDPGARGALGAFLAARGRLKVGAVLLEEARQFGGDRRVIDARLAHIYWWLGEWKALADLSATSSLSPSERARARWLASQQATRSGPDSSTVPLEPNDVFGLGRIVLDVGSVMMPADIDPNAMGLTLPVAIHVEELVRRFGSRGDTIFAVADKVVIGAQVLTNVPVRLEPGGRSRVGLDVLARLTPTLDLGARRLTLRAAAPRTSGGEPLPLLLGFPGVRIVARTGDAPVALESAAGRAALRGTRWTLDLRRGAVVVER